MTSVSPAPLILRKLDYKKTYKVSPVKKSADTLLSELSQHVKWLIKRHTKSPSEDYLIEQCFSRKSVFKNQMEVNAYCRANLILANRFLEALLKEMKSGKKTVSFYKFLEFKEILRDFLFDLKAIAEALEIQKNHAYTFFQGRKNYGTQTIEIFWFCRQLAYARKPSKKVHHLDRKMSQICSIFALRQALELKFQRIIGINIYNWRGDSPKLRHDFHYNFIEKNPSYFLFKKGNFQHTKKIYDWCNEIVHKAYQPTAWQIFFAIKISEETFYPTKATLGGEWSINNALQISDVFKMHRAFIQHFLSEYDIKGKQGIWGIEEEEPEAEHIAYPYPHHIKN